MQVFAAYLLLIKQMKEQHDYYLGYYIVLVYMLQLKKKKFLFLFRKKFSTANVPKEGKMQSMSSKNNKVTNVL